MVTCHILTWCPSLDVLYGNLLTLRTFRTGFPNARLVVTDNASCPEARKAIAEATAAVAGRYVQLDREVRHHEWLSRAIFSSDSPGRSVVILDPDVAFWESCEWWDFGALLAGRLIPTFLDEYAGCITAARLHTSFLWVPDHAALRREITEIGKARWEFVPFAPIMVPPPWRDGPWTRFDTGAALYGALNAERRRAVPFAPEQLDCYDHLFCGTHASRVVPKLRDGDRMLALHEAVRSGDVVALRGAWKIQEEHFREREVP